jgi:hypothetical protein
VQCQEPKLGLKGVTGLLRLTARNPGRYNDITQVAALICRKRQDIGRRPLPAITTVESPYSGIGDDRYAQYPSGVCRRN